MVVEPSLFFVQVDPSPPVMVDPEAALFTKFCPFSEPIVYLEPLDEVP